MPLQPGSRLGSYEILAPIGAGGMGEVHRARHLKLGREVAIKVLPASVADEPERLARFEREARTASALNHPNIVTIYDIATDDGVTYIAMELVEGRTLREILSDEPLPVPEALELASQICDGLAKAHEAGIVHRDIKPANLMVTDDGLVKILDFGIAKHRAEAARADMPSRDPGDTSPAEGPVDETRSQKLIGTPEYMSPEQLTNDPVDHRSDQFAFGAVVYELVTGRRPFAASSLPAVISAVLTRPVPSLAEVRGDVPADVDRLVRRCLGKDPDDRFADMRDVQDALARSTARLTSLRRRVAKALRRPVVALPATVLTLALIGAGVVWLLGAERRWAENEAMAEIEAFIDRGDLYGAYRTVLRAREVRPDDPELDRVVERITLPFSVDTDPEGARVLIREYGARDGEWLNMGATPLQLRAPYEPVHWRIEHEGYEAFEGAPFSGISIAALGQGLVLDPEGTRPPGTVRVPGGPVRVSGIVPDRPMATAQVGTFYLERHEVTNREFQEFVDAGGYQTAEWWPSPLTEGDDEIPWEAAAARFRDATGRPGPATWTGGSYPDGSADHPVGGISWFEARAYCDFVGRSLPTIYHWFHAVGQEQRSDILVHSNFDGDGKAPVGRFKGVSAYGAYDMAGNVKEWVWNASGDLRYLLGGSWSEPRYVFSRSTAQDPWSRGADHGVRCVEYLEEPDEHLRAPVTPAVEFPMPEPITDDAFELLRNQYAYDPKPLEPHVEEVRELPHYVQKTVSVTTAYSDERMDLHILLPREAEPPYETVVWYPGDDVFLLRSSESFSSAWLFDFLPEAGRAVIHPVYRGMYERYEPWRRTPNEWRDMVVSWSRDIGRAIDYVALDTDLDATEVAYYGFSAGAMYAPVFMAVEPRIETAMIIGGGGIPPDLPPAIQPAHFARRTETPVLMISGENDFMIPYETAQLPFLEMFGAPDDQKRLARLSGGHIPSDPRELQAEIIAWLDRQLGPGS